MLINQELAGAVCDSVNEDDKQLVSMPKGVVNQEPTPLAHVSPYPTNNYVTSDPSLTNQFSPPNAIEKANEPLLNVIPEGVLEVQPIVTQNSQNERDSVDGLLPLQANMTDVMLESVDLRYSGNILTESQHFTGLLPEMVVTNGTSNGGMWHGNVETSTDTLVPTNALTEEESRHFPGSANGNLVDFLTKRDENEKMRVHGIDDTVQSGIDCSVYGESSFNMDLLNNDSLYDITTGPNQAAAIEVDGHKGLTKKDTNLNILDLSLMDSVIQSQPMSAVKRRQTDTSRHRRTPSNSKSEPSPHKFQNGK